MKTKFATFDVSAVLHDLNKLKGMRVSNVYDINSKTYLLKMQRPNEKAFILFESGIRIHTTTYDWPKATIPSGFSMKFRKHINTKRLTEVSQVGADRIVDLQFGDAERSCHVIVELYDRGNVILTDHDYMILNILRPRTDHDKDVRFSVRERYPLEQAHPRDDFLPNQENILLFLQNASTGDSLKKSLVRHVPFGALLLEHAFCKFGIPLGAQIGVHIPQTEAGAELVGRALEEAKRVAAEIIENPHGGFIAYQEMARKGGDENLPPIQSFQEYYPFDFAQFRSPESKFQVLQFDTFSDAVDKFYSSIESQKAEQRVLVVEKEADKKLQNIKKDHEKRIHALAEVKEIQEKRGEYVLYNKEFVEQAIKVTKTALANLKRLNKELAAQHRGPKAPPAKVADLGAWLEQMAAMGEQPAARAVVKLKLDAGRITLRLSNPYEEGEQPVNVDLDLGMNADQNARRLFEEKRAAETKKEKTAAATKKALKGALKSAKQQATNKINQAKMRQTNVIRARKSYWFEKFLWFISSDGYLVLAGRDAQQNELLVKRYMRPGDIYVHAEIQGAASVVIRNHGKSAEELPPPRTLNEAGAFAVCFSTAWEANVSITSWWVKHDQVSRTAPAGEYLVAGSFMIRGKRNFLSSSPLHLGFGLMFKLDDESVARHRQLSQEEKQQQRSRTQSEETEATVVETESVVCEDEEEEVADEENEDEEDLDEGDETEEEFPDVQVRLTGSTHNQNAENENEANEKEGENADGENEIEEEEEEGADLNEDEALLESLTPSPLAEDQLLFVLPVCAPYTAMQRFKFKVKITPGTGKRGRAVKMALDLFNRDKTLSLMERTLLKALVGDDRLMQVLPGKVRVSAPALNTKFK